MAENSSRKKQIDMLHGSLADKLILFALPLAFTGILQQLFNAADIAVVGRFVGREAMAAVGSDSPIVALIVHLFVGLSLGANVVIASAVGRGDLKMVRRAVHTSLLFSVIVGCALSVLCELYAGTFVRMMDVPAEVYSMAEVYLKIYLTGLPVIMLYNFEAAVYRSVGNTRTPLAALTVSGVVNVILNVFFVVVLGMDVDGVAWATVISNGISAAMLLFLLVRDKSAVSLNFREVRIDAGALKRILRIGLPAGVQGMIFSISNIIIQTAINSLGTVVMAASSAAYNVEVAAYCVINAFAQACTTFVGQNFGARNLPRCRRVLWESLLLDSIFNAAACLLILCFGHAILACFNPDKEVIAVGLVRLKYIFLAYIFSVFQEVFSGYMRGYGVSSLPAVLSMAGICGTRILWIYTVFRAHSTFQCIMQVYPVSLIVTASAIALAALACERRIRKNAGAPAEGQK